MCSNDTRARVQRILTFCYEYPPLGGGGAKVVESLATIQIMQGVEVDLVTMWMPGLKVVERKHRLTIYRLPCIRTNRGHCYAAEMIPYLLLAFPFGFFLRLTRRYSLSHSHFIFPDGLAAVALRQLTGLRAVITAHGSDVPGYNPDRFKRLHRLLEPAWRFVTSRADCIVCPSRSIKRLILRHNPAAATAVIPNGIDVTRFDPTRKKRPLILSVSRMFPRKGMQAVVKAVHAVNPEGWETVIVGDGPFLRELRKLNEGPATVELTGHLDNREERLRTLYETAAIFVFPSHSENFPIVLLEALSAGAAVITSRGTGCEDVVGDAALLLDPGDQRQLEEALRRLIGNPELRADLGARGRRRVVAMFSDECFAKRHSELYERISAEPR